MRCPGRTGQKQQRQAILGWYLAHRGEGGNTKTNEFVKRGAATKLVAKKPLCGTTPTKAKLCTK